MGRQAYICFLIVLVVVTAGCAGTKKTEIVSSDMLKINGDIDIFPSKTVNPDDTIIIRMEVKNVGQDKVWMRIDGKDGYDNSGAYKPETLTGDYILIDHCESLYKYGDKAPADFKILTAGKCEKNMVENKKIKDGDGKPLGGCYLKFDEGQSHTFQWSLKAPGNDAIAKMTNKCTFKFQTAYAATAQTNTYVYFADPLEVAQRLYSGKDMNLAGDNIAAYGPVAVNFETAEPQPIAARSEAGAKWTVYLNMRNVGGGIASVNSMNIEPSGDIALINPENSVCGFSNNDLNELNTLKTLKTATYGNLNTNPTTTTNNEPAVRDIILYYRTYCSIAPYKNEEICVNQEIKSTVARYELLCGINLPAAKDTEICDKTLEQLDADLKKDAGSIEAKKRLLTIYDGSSSRVPCDFSMPKKVKILTPFKFKATADYTYKIRKDIEITTKPLKGVY